MICKHAKVEGNTTKYYVCSVKDKATDEYECRNCPMFIKDNNAEDVINQLFSIVGGKR